MTIPIYPTVSGLTYPLKWTPNAFNAATVTTPAGSDIDLGLGLYPAHVFDLQYEFLRDRAADPAFKTLMGFVRQIGGPVGRFLFLHPDDQAVVGQALATGDGTATVFTLVRTYGAGGFGLTEPVGYVDNTSLKVYLNGVLQTSGYTLDRTTPTAQTITFASAPGSGVAITADFSFWYYCKFADADQPFNKFMDKLWSADKITLRSIPAKSGVPGSQGGGGGGGGGGTPASFVQAASAWGARSATFGSAPTNGHMLVALGTGPNDLPVNTADGWQLVDKDLGVVHITGNPDDTIWGVVAWKRAGASEPALQTPFSGPAYYHQDAVSIVELSSVGDLPGALDSFTWCSPTSPASGPSLCTATTTSAADNVLAVGMGGWFYTWPYWGQMGLLMSPFQTSGAHSEGTAAGSPDPIIGSSSTIMGEVAVPVSGTTVSATFGGVLFAGNAVGYHLIGVLLVLKPT